MQMLMWVFCTTLVLMLIISFLPLGFTKKGIIFCVFSSFVLAEAGLAAITAFSLWQTALLLVVLVFFSAYILQKRMGTFLFKEVSPINDGFENEVVNIQTDEQFLVDIHSLDLAATEIPIVLKEALTVETTLLAEKVIRETEHLSKIDEDISFLEDRNVDLDVTNHYEVSEPELGYLSEIESMLEDEKEEKENIIFQKGSSVVLPELDEIDLLDKNQLFDDSFDFYLAADEVAAGKELVKEEEHKADQKS